MEGAFLLRGKSEWHIRRKKDQSSNPLIEMVEPVRSTSEGAPACDIIWHD